MRTHVKVNPEHISTVVKAFKILTAICTQCGHDAVRQKHFFAIGKMRFPKITESRFKVI